jgi:protein TonB
MTRRSKIIFVPTIALVGLLITSFSFVGASAADTQPKRIRVSAKLMSENLKYRVEPIYPEAAREYNIEGIVKLSAVIGTDGHVLSLVLQSGHPLLVAAALNAVKQWRYEPMFLNGDPVEVVTAIEVMVSLPQKK